MELDRAPSLCGGWARELLAVLKTLQQLASDKPKRSLEDELNASPDGPRGGSGSTVWGPDERGVSALAASVTEVVVRNQ
jgi:hypothetical protein